MKRILAGSCLIILSFFLIVMTSCTKAEENMVESPERKRIQLQNEMTSFFKEHQNEMQAFALRMKELNDNDPIYHYLYAVKENALIQFDGEHLGARGKVTEHPILSDAAFFNETSAFEWVEWLTVRFDCYACFFTGEVYDETSTLYAELFVFYSEAEPVTDEYITVEPLAENWYYYCEYRQ